jgi:serine/threonine protein kinase
MESSGGVATEVAITVLRADFDPGSDSVKRLRDEGRLLGKLSHPSIVKVHDLIVLDGRVSLVCEYIEGQDLDQCFKGSEPLPARALVLAIGDVASALDGAWASPSPISNEPLRLIHRDVKPANIRIGRHGEVKLLDFGIARASNEVREAHTAANAMMGSYQYMAPERFHEDDVMTPSDVFALGSVLYEGLAGERFFGGMSLQQVYAFMLSASRFNRRLEERVADLSLDVPESVLNLVREMMAPNPDTRPTSSEVAQRCEDLAEDLPGHTLKRWCRNRSWGEPAEFKGSLDGRILTDGGFAATQEPPPLRGPAVPSPSALPPAPPSGLRATSAFSMPPQANSAPSPQPQSLSASAGMVPGKAIAPSLAPRGPALPSQPAAADMPSLGEPGFGDFSAARADAGGDEPQLSFGVLSSLDDDLEFKADLAARQAKNRRRSWMIAVVLCGTALMVGSFAFVMSRLVDDTPIQDVVAGDGEATDGEGTDGEATDGEATDGEATDGEATDGEATDGEGTDGEATAVEPTPEPAPEPTTQADAAPEPAPAPAAPKPVPKPSSARLISQGWAKTSDPPAAAALFKQALDVSPGNLEASYGYGYAMAKNGDLATAKTYLCKVRDSDFKDASEVAGVTVQFGIICD